MADSKSVEGDLRDVRVCVFGDSLVAGFGDPKALGWVGRVAARTPPSTGVGLVAYPLGVVGETAEEVVVRMPLECAARFARGDEHCAVVSVGVSDASRQVGVDRSTMALGFGLEAVGVRTLVVGPPPLGDDAMQERIQTLDAAYAGLCERREIPYISTFDQLSNRKAWADARAEDGFHPNQTGYGLLAHVVLNSGWYDWLGVKPPSSPVKARHT